MADATVDGFDKVAMARLVRATVGEDVLRRIVGSRDGTDVAPFVVADGAHDAGPSDGSRKARVGIVRGADGSPQLAPVTGVDLSAENRRMAEVHGALKDAPRTVDDPFADPATLLDRARTAIRLTGHEATERLAAGLNMIGGPNRVSLENLREPNEAMRKGLPADHDVAAHLVDVVRLDPEGKAVARRPAILIVSHDAAVPGSTTLSFHATPVFGAPRANDDLQAFNGALEQPWAAHPGDGPHRAARRLHASGGIEETKTSLFVTKGELEVMAGGRAPRGRRESDLAMLGYAVSVTTTDTKTRRDGSLEGQKGAEVLERGFGRPESGYRRLELDPGRVTALAVAGGPSVEDALLRLAATNDGRARKFETFVERERRAAERDGIPPARPRGGGREI